MSASPDLSAAVADSDAEQLRQLGYTSNFNRSMSLWENFALGFTYLSPVVGVYTLFGLIIALGFFLQDAVATIVSFAAIGIYLAFQMIVLAALYARSKGWKPSGKFTLGAWGWPVNIGALVYGVGAIINMAWPRTLDAAWYINYAMVLSTAIVIGLGLIYMWIGKPYDHGKAPAGDAWKVSR